MTYAKTILRFPVEAAIIRMYSGKNGISFGGWRESPLFRAIYLALNFGTGKKLLPKAKLTHDHWISSNDDKNRRTGLVLFHSRKFGCSQLLFVANAAQSIRYASRRK